MSKLMPVDTYDDMEPMYNRDHEDELDDMDIVDMGSEAFWEDRKSRSRNPFGSKGRCAELWFKGWDRAAHQEMQYEINEFLTDWDSDR